MFQFPAFALYPYFIQSIMTTYAAGFPHSDIFGSSLICQLPEAFRRLLRPSSPLTAKASIVCAYSLDYISLKCFLAISLYHKYKV